MSIVHNLPSAVWQEMAKLFDRLPEGNHYSSDSSVVETGKWAPAVDIQENENNFVICADLPGVEKDNIDVSMENNQLAIKGERNQIKEENHKGFIRTERVSGTFYRRFTLPETADGDNITAKMEKGVLEVTIPKKEVAKARSISISGE